MCAKIRSLVIEPFALINGVSGKVANLTLQITEGTYDTDEAAVANQGTTFLSIPINSMAMTMITGNEETDPRRVVVVKSENHVVLEVSQADYDTNANRIYDADGLDSLYEQIKSTLIN